MVAINQTRTLPYIQAKQMSNAFQEEYVSDAALELSE
jgi:hypothetical protein